jgi:hypothetical protein
MKPLMIAVSLAVLATSGAAYAADSAPVTVGKSDALHQGQLSSESTALPRSRAQVREELVQAQKSGELAYLNKTLYRSGS